MRVGQGSGSDTYYCAARHALILLGHAPPSDEQEDFFLPVLDALREGGGGIPALCLHASARGGSFVRHVPFGNAGEPTAMWLEERGREAGEPTAVRLEERGREAPLRVVVRRSGDGGGERGRGRCSHSSGGREPRPKRAEK